jgi:RNA polymerase sigma factor (sigma-70 family)
MTVGPVADAMRQTGVLFESGNVAGMSDGQLLDRFVTGRGEAAEMAFRALVSRHGPMVLGVCRRILPQAHDADDAFQATFLILVRKARSVRIDDSIGRWLYGVSRRVAVRARSVAAKRQAREVVSSEQIPASTVRPELVDLALVLDEEIGRLSARHRAVVVLCDLQGFSQEEAARQLHCPVGTIKSRLNRARDQLRTRLTRRGLAPSAIALGPGLVAPEVPIALMDTTVQAALGSASAPVATLVKGILMMMFMTNVKHAVTVAVAIAVVTTGALTLRSHGQAPPAGQGVQPKAADSAPARPKAMTLPYPYVVEPPDLLEVEVLTALEGRPITGERLVRPDGTISLGFYGDVYVAGKTLPEVKEAVIEHLRPALSDEALGLAIVDPDTGMTTTFEPTGSRTVYVDVASYNSKSYYVAGDVWTPGKYPITGNETVLDAINNAAGLLFDVDKSTVQLVRPAPPGACCEQTLPVDLAAILKGKIATNYQVLPADRILVSADPKAKAARPVVTTDRALEMRVQALERKLDLVLKEVRALNAEKVKGMPDELLGTYELILQELRARNGETAKGVSERDAAAPNRTDPPAPRRARPGRSRAKPEAGESSFDSPPAPPLHPETLFDPPPPPPGRPNAEPSKAAPRPKADDSPSQTPMPPPAK